MELDGHLNELLELSLGKPRGLGIQHRREGQGTRLSLFPFQFLQQGFPGLMGAAARSLWVLLSFPSFLATWSISTCTQGWVFPAFPYFPSCWIVYFLHELAFFSVNLFLQWRLVFHRDLELKNCENKWVVSCSPVVYTRTRALTFLGWLVPDSFPSWTSLHHKVKPGIFSVFSSSLTVRNWGRGVSLLGFSGFCMRVLFPWEWEQCSQSMSIVQEHQLCSLPHTSQRPHLLIMCWF